MYLGVIRTFDDSFEQIDEGHEDEGDQNSPDHRRAV
jgi:hypothetical protein